MGTAMRPRRIMIGSTAMMAVCALAACGSSSSGTASGSSAGGSSGAADKSLVVETAFQLKTADPARMFEPTGLLIDHALYSTLLTFAGGDVKKPLPDLAESYTASADAKVY